MSDTPTSDVAASESTATVDVTPKKPRTRSAVAAAMGEQPKEVTPTIPADLLNDAEATAEAIMDEPIGREIVAREILGEKIGALGRQALEHVQRYADAVKEVTLTDDQGIERTYRCFTILTLKGKRARYIGAKVADIMPLLTIVDSGMDIVAVVGHLLKDDTLIDIVGASYVPVDGYDDFDPATARAMGEKIGAEFTLESYAGVLYRFFSLKGSGLEGAFLDSLKGLTSLVSSAG